MSIQTWMKPDGLEVVTTLEEARALASPPLLVLEPVTAFFDKHGLGTGPLRWERIGNGQSNITYRIRRGQDTFVLRRGPRPPLPRSTHNMIREARIQQLLRAEGIPVPKILAVCEDESLLGVPFYVMSYVDGVVITDRVPPALGSLEQRDATSRALVDALTQLHRVDATQGDIASLGRADGYLKRQVQRFSGLWDTNTTRHLPQIEKLTDWLERNCPMTQAVTVVHGDYRMGNLMFADHGPACVVGILDWEMATLGDPLADLGYLTATYGDHNSTPTIMELTPVTSQPGYWTRAQIVDRYGHQSGLDLGALPWYQTLALWKSAIFCEAIYTRWLNGERPDDDVFGPSLQDGVPLLLEQAAQQMR
ncbi:phosphotransferase family protein [Arthrobacter alkaliphilus]|uniref:phosphotransferase family protein n=1 Tax=Arthrobacter alkaliphilus TaxID=369936 RepID=UPI001F3D9293|nr:phosphotransferase family protein [Arthrobacter alkaliphilus]